MFLRGCAAILFLFTSIPLLRAAETKADPTPEQIQSIINRFVQKETEFAKARDNYVYRQTNKLIEVDPPGGTYEMVEEVTFDNRNRRIEHVTRAPVTTLQNILMTPEDEQDMRNVMPFVMTNDTRDQYIINYVGREQVDEIPCYVFAVRPKELTKDRKRYFEGQIWVDDRDLQIVKTYGRSTGYLRKHEDQQFPKFETYREQIDGKYWFPTYTYADDTLNFQEGPSQRIKVIIKYDQYKKFSTETTITYGDVSSDNTPPSINSSPAPPNPPK
ncbi:MAG: hypothetical protein JOY62_14840 [Acidobacteriaceae bacterium]|nr:hypothetical protein [Acidobacteriaceae bacterium]MBV9781238.1 hypothetical protein [Acidobacteriaceae bacterium]